MQYIYALCMTMAVLMLPLTATAAVSVDPHTNIPDTDEWVAYQLNDFRSYVQNTSLSNEELSIALSDLSDVLRAYESILSRRGQ